MIKVMRLDGKSLYVNPHQIEFIEENPDVSLIMLSGKKIILRESIEEVLKKIIEYRKQIGVWNNEN
ncbi:MAG: flagellar protein FlbD [Spirochaetaceae bacterium]|nr:flagellar protein FlbD [Spirochaetaceae bacterium]